MLATNFPLFNIFLSILYFFLFFMWIMLLFQVFGDIFRSHDMGGGSKALWVVFVLVLPFLGVLVYLIARGGKMAEHQQAAMQAQQDAMAQYIQQTAGTAPSASAELERLHGLKEKGVIDEAEYQSLKAKVVS